VQIDQQESCELKKVKNQSCADIFIIIMASKLRQAKQNVQQYQGEARTSEKAWIWSLSKNLAS